MKLIVLLLCILMMIFVIPVLAQDATGSCSLLTLPTLEAAPEVILIEGDLYLNQGGETTRLTEQGNVTSFVTSGDQQTIAYIGYDEDAQTGKPQYQVWAMELDGSNQRLLLSAEQLATMRTEDYDFSPAVLRLDWMPNSRKLLMNTFGEPTNKEGIFVPIADDLWLIDADTTEVTNLLPQGEGGEFLTSPDGLYILVMGLDKILLMNADGSNPSENLLVGYKPVGAGHGFIYPAVHWSDDSSYFTTGIVSKGDGWMPDSEVTAYRVITWDYSVTQLGTFQAFFPSFHISPDMRYVAYWRTHEAGSNLRELRFATIDGSVDEQFLEAELLDFLGWKDDSQHFEYSLPDQEPMVATICILPGLEG